MEYEDDIPEAAYNEMSRDERNLIEFDPGKWSFDFEARVWRNLENPKNDAYKQMREALEARAFFA